METDTWEKSVREWIAGNQMNQATLSQPRRKDGSAAARTVVRPVQLKNGLFYQFEYHTATKVTHENLQAEEASGKLVTLLAETYRQALIKTTEADVQILFNKKGKAAMLRKPPTGGGAATVQSHNRQKSRVLEEGIPVPFLVELGIMTKEGKVHAQKQDKYRQINRFLEMVEDVLDDLPQGRELRIVDFGCGKSYLTFALYHLLAVRQGRKIRVIGLDLKADVIAFCSDLAERLGYDNLRFLQGDIADYNELSEVDMVVTLHACDTATDAALAKAVRWGASVILSVPCCQHELFGQIASVGLNPLLSHGLLKERFAALATDAVRAQLLQVLGYKVQMLEFIDPEHTPKNVLIRAVKGSGGNPAAKWAEYEAFKTMLGLSPYLESALADLWPHTENERA
jgi:SAM-dependent methyltransferase